MLATRNMHHGHIIPGVTEKGFLDRAGISRRLREARDQAGMSRVQVIELLDEPVHPNALEQWENPKIRTVPFDQLLRLASLYGVTIGWLLRGEEDPDDQVTVALELVDRTLGHLVERVEALEGQQAALVSLVKQDVQRRRTSE